MNQELYTQIGAGLAESHGSSQGQMFGKPCLKIGKKAFALFYDDAMVFKLGKQEVDLYKAHYPSASNFDPSGKNRPMKDWLQLPGEFSKDWETLAIEALEYVEKLG